MEYLTEISSDINGVTDPNIFEFWSFDVCRGRYGEAHMVLGNWRKWYQKVDGACYSCIYGIIMDSNTFCLSQFLYQNIICVDNIRIMGMVISILWNFEYCNTVVISIRVSFLIAEVHKILTTISSLTTILCYIPGLCYVYLTLTS